MNTTDASRAAFEEWAKTTRSRANITYHTPNGDCLPGVDLREYLAWQASRKVALSEAVDHADEWSNYVVEDAAPETLRARMEKLK